MNTKYIGYILILITIAIAMFCVIVPVKSEVVFTARLTKVEYGGFGGDDYYYFSNGRIEDDLVMRETVIGGRYRVKCSYSLIGLRIFLKAYLIG